MIFNGVASQRSTWGIKGFLIVYYYSFLKANSVYCQTPDFKFSPRLKIWSGSIFGVLFSRLFVSLYAIVRRSVVRLAGWWVRGFEDWRMFDLE